MKYYIVKNGQNAGPFEVGELQAQGLTAETYVWCEGMADWKHAGEVAELAELLKPVIPPVPPTPPTPPAPPASPVSPTPQVAQTTPVSSTENKLFNWLPYAIVATVLGTLFFGIGSVPGVIAIVLSINAQRMHRQGYYEQARQKNRLAMILTIVGAGLGMTFMPLCFMM